MSQFDLEDLESEAEEGLAELQPAPGKATLTSRIGRPPRRGGDGDLLDAATHAQLQGGLGVELSRGDGGDGDGGPSPRRYLAVGFLGGQGADLGSNLSGEQAEERPLGRGLDYLSSPSANASAAELALRGQQREVKQFDSEGDFYDQRATVEPRSSEGGDEAEPASAARRAAPAATRAATRGIEARRPLEAESARRPSEQELRSQQREVRQFDSEGDFYDERAVVDVEGTRARQAAQAAEVAPSSRAQAMTPTAAADRAGTASAEPRRLSEQELRSQQRAVRQFDSEGDFYDERAVVDVEGTRARQAAQALAETPAGTAARTGADAAPAVVQALADRPPVGSENLPARTPGAPPAQLGDLPLDAIDPDPRRLPGMPGRPGAPRAPGEVPLDAIDPDLRPRPGLPGRPGRPGASGEVPLDATDPSLRRPGQPGAPGAPGAPAIDGIDPELRESMRRFGDAALLDPFGDDELLFDPAALDQLMIDPALRPPGAEGGDPARPELQGLDAKVEAARANPQQSRQLLEGVRAESALKKQGIQAKVEAKTGAVGKVATKGAAGAVAKGGKKVQTAAGKGKVATDKAKGQGDKKKVEKAKSIDELKARLETSFKTQQEALTTRIGQQKTELDTKLKAEQAKIDVEMAKAADALAKELATKNQEIDKKLAEKKKAYDKQLADDKKKAEQTCKTEQQKTRTTTAKEVAKIEKQGAGEAQKVIQQGHKDAAAARAEGNRKASALAAQANQKAAGVEDAAQKSSIVQQGQNQAAAARNAANAKAKQLDAAAHAEADKRKALTKQLVDETKAKGEKALADLETKLKQSLDDLARKAADGLAKMEAERKQMVADVKAFEDKARADHAKKNEDAKFKIHTLKLDSEKRIKDMETNGLKGIQQKRDDMLLKLEKGNAADLAKLEEETNKIVGEIEQSVKATAAAIDKEIKIAQDKAAHEAKKRTDAIAADGKKQLDELNRKVAEVEAKIEQIDAATKAGMKKAAEDARVALEQQGEQDRAAIVAGADRAVTELAKSSEQYEADKKAEEEAARRKEEEERKAKEAEEQAKADAEKKKEEEKKAEEERKKKEFEAKIKGAADELFKAMDGWGTDEKAVFNALKGKTPEEIAAIKEAYQKKTGRSLDKDLADEMSGTDLKEAKALLSPDPVQQAVASLQNATEGWGTDEEKVKQTLAGITDPEMKKKVIAEYEKQTGERLQKVLEDEGMAKEGVDTAEYARAEEDKDKGPQRELSEDEKKGARAAVSELEGAMHRWGTDEAKLFAALKGKSPEELDFIKSEYKRRHGKDLDSVLEDELSGTDLKEARALMSADPVQQAVAQLHNAADGLGTDKEKVLSTLKDIKDPEVRKQVAAEYEKQTGDSLGAMLEDELSGMDKDLAVALSGDAEGNVNQGEVAAIEADKAMRGGFLTDISDGMADTFGVDRDEMRKAVGNAILPGLGDLVGTDIGGTDEEALYKALESCETEADRKKLKDAYKARTGRELEADLKEELTEKEGDVTTAILAGDKITAEAAKMAAAADGLGTDRKALYAALEGKNKDEREAIIAKFNEKYGKDWPKEIDPKTGKELSPFEAMCKDELDDLDQKKAAQIAEAGKMEDGFALYYAMNEGFLGIGTDDAALKEKLKGKSKEEVLALQKAYLKAKCEAEGLPVPDLDNMKPDDPALQALNNDIAGETSGRTGHDLKQSLKGNPTTPEEMLQRAKEDYEFERKSSGWIGEAGMMMLVGPVGYAQLKASGVEPHDLANGLTDLWSDSGKQLDRDYADLVKEYEALKAKYEADPELAKLPPEERKKKIDEAMMADLKQSGQADYVEGSVKQFGEAKDATADAVGTAVAIAVGAVITIASGGTAAPALVALISGLAGVSAKMIIKGASMSNEELVQELAQVAAEAIAAGVVKLPKIDAAISKLAGKFGNGLAAKIIQEALEEAIESGTEELINALLDEDLYKGDLADFAKGIGGRVGKAALTGAGAAVVSTGFGDLMPGMQKLATKGATGKAVNSAINQAVGAAFTTAIDPNTYQGSGADVALAFGKSMGSAAVRGLRDGYSSGEGWKSGPISKADTKAEGPTKAKADVTTTGTATTADGDAKVEVKTTADVDKGPSSVKVDATAETTIETSKGSETVSESTSKTLPLDTQQDTKGDSKDTKGTTQDGDGRVTPVDPDSHVDKDPSSAESTPLDGMDGAGPDSKVPVDTNAKTQAEIEAAKQAHAGGDPVALENAIKALPGTANLNVVADATPGPLAANQITATQAAKLLVMMDSAMKSKVGQDALKALQDLGVELTMEAGVGSFRQGNRINIDPSMASNGQELAGILAHEVHHAKTFDSDVDITQSRDQYVAATLKNEAEAQAALFEHYQQTGSIAGAQNQFGATQYFSAYDAAAKAFVEANPQATPAEVHAHAKQAGITALTQVFGDAIPSTSVDENGDLIPGKPANYAELYGGFHDAHSPVGLVAQNTGSPIPSTQAAPEGVVPVEGPDPKLVALTQQAYDKYSTTLGDAKALLENVLGGLGEVQGRAKDPVSAANRLQRAIDNFGAKVTDVDSAIANIWDAIGTRIVVGQASPEVMAQVVQKLQDAIASGQLKISMINNLHGQGAKPYLSAEQVKALADAGKAATGAEVTTNASKVMPGGFTSVCIYVEYANGVKGEIQIIGQEAMDIAGVEHIPYDVGIGKPLVRGIDPSLQPELASIVGPIEGAIKAVNADPTLKAAYEQYLSQMYAHARNLEMGIESVAPDLPAGIDKALSVEGLKQVYAAIEALKAKQKALEAEQKETKGEVKAPSPKVVVVPNPEADAMSPPTSKQELLAFVQKKYGNVIDKYVGADKTANPKYESLLAELQAVKPGEWASDPEKAAAALDKWMAISAEIEAETGKSEADLRELYNIVEKTDMPRWLSMMEGKTDKEKAELLYEMRKEWRILVRDLMTDDNAKEILYLRDRALSGHRTGPAMQDLLDRNLAKTGGDLDAAYRRIVESAMRSNERVNKGITGSATGIKTEGDAKNDNKSEGEQKTELEDAKKQLVPAPLKGAPTQTSNDIDVLFEQAAEADPILRALTAQIAAETGGQPMFPPGLKGKERTMEKIAADYGGDASRIMDLSRASIVYDNFDSLQKGLAALEGKVEIVRDKNRFEKPTSAGYRDVTLNLRMPNGHIVELQLHLKQIMEVKQGKGHDIYEQVRTIEAKAQKEGRDLTAEEVAQIQKLEAESRALYDAALANAMSPDDDAGGTATRNAQRVAETKAEREKAFAELGVQGETGRHGGTEVHSHFLGVISNEVFAEKYGGWMNLLTEIVKLNESAPQLAHKLNKDGTRVVSRGTAGDALRIATQALEAIQNETHPQIVALKERLAGNPALATELRTLKDRLARGACDTCLAASEETDFNSAYEIRDELIKNKFGGDKAANESREAKAARENAAYFELAVLTVRRLIEDGILLTEQSNSIKKLQDRFVGPDGKGDPGLIARAIAQVIGEIEQDDPERAAFLRKELRVVFLSMGLSAFYGKQDRRWEGFLDQVLTKEQKAELEKQLAGKKGYERTKVLRAFERADNQSKWLVELVNQFGYDQAVSVLRGELDNLRAQLADQQKDGKQGTQAQRRIAELEGYIDELTQPGPDGKPNRFQGMQKTGVVHRSDIVGIDTAGQELYEFTPTGRERFKIMYLALVEAARAKGEVLVFRPHVGEGAINPERGAFWNAFNNRWEGPDGKPIHYERAERNVTAMLKVLLELKEQGLLDPRAVTIRFGHATHTNPEQAALMAELGVIAEANLGSNIATNVVDQATGEEGARGKKTEEDFEDHSFLTLLFNRVQTILSTDGHAVEKTTMGDEYARAHKIIEKFLAGNMTVRVTPEQAAGRGTRKGQWVELSVAELNPDELERFIQAYRQLHAWARQYRETGQRGGSPLAD